MGKRHLRIHPLNRSILLKYPADHPAVRALQIHAEARDICVGKEIDWPRFGSRAIDQEWFSTIDQRLWLFSAFAYAFISFDLILDGWLDMTEIGPFEKGFLYELPRLRELLSECEVAAKAEENNPILPLTSKAREFFDALEKSIIARKGPVIIEFDDEYIAPKWGTGKREP